MLTILNPYEYNVDTTKVQNLITLLLNNSFWLTFAFCIFIYNCEFK